MYGNCQGKAKNLSPLLVKVTLQVFVGSSLNLGIENGGIK